MIAGRLAWLDVARGIALVGMAVYHFVWDLTLFGLVEPGVPFEPGWKLLARGVATSFLFLVGLGLVIAHGRAIRWRSFLRRFAKIAGAAALITLATFFAIPDQFIFFGILHMIALGSLLGLALVARPALVAIVVGLAVAVIGFTVEAPVFDRPVFWWTGLGTLPIRSNDLVPFFPAFAAICAGIAVGKLTGLADRTSSPAQSARASRTADLTLPLAFLGRHSLATYLLHQPVLIGLLWLAVRSGVL